jgi:spoIIIJ-associated protein
MSDKVELEIEGKTVGEAVKKALKELKLKRSQINIEVLCEEEKGLFGMAGAKLAKIKVSVKSNKEKS